MRGCQTLALCVWVLVISLYIINLLLLMEELHQDFQSVMVTTTLHITVACLSRCVVKALFCLATTRQPSEPTYANPLLAMTYTRC